MQVDEVAILVLKELQRRRMSQAELGKRAGLNRWTVSRWLSGARSIRLIDALHMMAVLDLTVVPRRVLNGQATKPRTQGLYRRP